MSFDEHEIFMKYIICIFKKIIICVGISIGDRLILRKVTHPSIVYTTENDYVILSRLRNSYIFSFRKTSVNEWVKDIFGQCSINNNMFSLILEVF